MGKTRDQENSRSNSRKLETPREHFRQRWVKGQK